MHGGGRPWSKSREGPGCDVLTDYLLCALLNNIGDTVKEDSRCKPRNTAAQNGPTGSSPTDHGWKNLAVMIRKHRERTIPNYGYFQTSLLLLPLVDLKLGI